MMRAAGIAGVSRRRSAPVTTRQARDHHPASDLVRRNFMADRPNALWMADITFLPTLAGFLYLAVVLDAWSRRIVGWAFSSDLKTRVVIDAFDMALAARKPDNVVHHSDRGSQYTSIAFGNRCKEAGVHPSTGSVGDAYDNAMCESFFATLECELIDRLASDLAARRGWPSFSSSKASTIPHAATRLWAIFRPSNTKGNMMA